MNNNKGEKHIKKLIQVISLVTAILLLVTSCNNKEGDYPITNET